MRMCKFQFRLYTIRLITDNIYFYSIILLRLILITSIHYKAQKQENSKSWSITLHDYSSMEQSYIKQQVNDTSLSMSKKHHPDWGIAVCGLRVMEPSFQTNSEWSWSLHTSFAARWGRHCIQFEGGHKFQLAYSVSQVLFFIFFLNYSVYHL